MGGVVISTYTGAETAQGVATSSTRHQDRDPATAVISHSPLGQTSDILTTCQGDMGHGSDLSVGYSIISVQFSSS